MGTAMFTGVTGMLVHQKRMDVVANNIANVNTTGYRGSRAQFQDLLSATIQGGTAPQGTFGGTNPKQVGLGVGMSAIDIDFSSGSPTTTGVESDLAIQGNGFFVLANGQSLSYTRDGTFGTNTDGLLIDPGTGFHVQGYMADADGNIPADAPLGDLTIPIGSTAIVQATQNAEFVGNLDSDADVGTTVQRSLRVYDSLGTARDLQLTFTKRTQVMDGATAYNAWTYAVTYDSTNVSTIPAGQTGVLLFDTDGGFHAEGAVTGAGVFTARSALANQSEVSIPAAVLGGSALPSGPFEFNLLYDSVTNLSSVSDMTLKQQDGYPRGVLENFHIGTDGMITGVFTNGLSRNLGQVALSTFANVGGLSRTGNNAFVETPASGAAQIGGPGTGGRGTILGGSLEGSNVDLGTEFSNMIITQRGYQANARTITTADTMLQEAVNLVR